MNGSDSRDLAGAGMPLHELERLLGDMENEPNWRPEANKCADYYDHKQASAERIQRSLETGEPLTITNLIQRTVNGALGQEAKTRLNWKVEADSAAFSDVAAVLSERLHEFQREAKADMAVSEAYKSMLVSGIGWVEVSRNPDPLAYPYRCVAVHRNEVWWDWRAKQADKSDARWIVRQRWVDLDEAIVTMPQFRQVLEIGCHSGPITDAMARTFTTTRDQFESIYAARRSFSRVEEEWLDNSLRKRVRFYSVYYKAPKQEVALAFGTRRVKFNPQNPLHAALLQGGGAKLVKGPSYEIRHAMFAGPYRLFDVALRTRKYPLIPFVCYSCDDDRSPYGLVHGMIGPQDEFNERRSRLLWLLKAKQVFVDNDALDTNFNDFHQVAQEAMRPDAMFVLNAKRTNANGLVINSNLGLQKEQADVMMNAQQLIQEVPGIYSSMLGNSQAGVTSGLAINSLVEQSIVALGETSDNYRTSRQDVGDLGMALAVEDLMEPGLQVEVGTGRKRRVVVLNATDERGLPVNQVEDAAVRTGLGDIPQTPAFRGQQQAFLTQAIQSLGNDPAARAILVPALLEASDIEHGPEYARWMRQQAGVPEPDEMGDDEFAAMQQQREQAMQGQQQAQQAIAQSAQQANEAKAAKDMTTAQLNQARAAEIAARLAAPPDHEAAIADALAEADQGEPQAA